MALDSEQQFAKNNGFKIYAWVADFPQSKAQEVPYGIDFITGLTTRLHKKQTTVKGEVTKVEYFESYNGVTYTNPIVKEEFTYTRDALGFAVSRTHVISWTKNDGTWAEQTKSSLKYYSNLDKIDEGKGRRETLYNALQFPILGLMGMYYGEGQNPSPETVLKGRAFLADYKDEFAAFVEASNKSILSVLGNPMDLRYAQAMKYPWIEYMTPYGVTIRQFMIGEFTI